MVTLSERQDHLKQALASFIGNDGYLNASVVSRDGISVMSASRRDVSEETFSAMSATLLGAAEIALSEFNAGRMIHVITETENLRLVVQGIGDEFILIALAEKGRPLDSMLEAVGKTAAEVTGFLG